MEPQPTPVPVPPLLLLAVGNRSRGDDALGPMLLDRLHDHPAVRAGGVELLEDFQLQVEHALDLAGRRAVLFADAARPRADPRVTVERIGPDANVLPASHALRPQAVLRVALDLHGHLPEAWLLSIPGGHFALGAKLSAGAEGRLAQAVGVALHWLATHGGASAEAAAPTPTAAPCRSS
jgi:hydrogenase maturation protease